MAKLKFSRKQYEADMEKHFNEAKAFWESDKGKKLIKKHKATPNPVVETIGLEYIKFMKDFKEKTGKNVSDYFREFRDKSEEECRKIIISMKDHAVKKGWIHPQDEDELCGFFIWLSNQNDMIDTEMPERTLYEKFNNYIESLHIDKRVNEAIEWFEKELTKFDTTEQKLHFINNEIKRNKKYEKQFEDDGIKWLDFADNLIDFKGWFFYTDYVNSKKREFEKKVKAVKFLNSILTYTWLGKKNELNEFYNKMKENFIDKNSTEENFYKIFSGINIQEIHPIEWASGNATELLYFINEMMEGGLIKKERMDYKRLSACFCKPNGTVFNENFKELYQPIKNGISTQRNKIIDLIKSCK